MAEYTRDESRKIDIPRDFADKKIGMCPFCKVEEPKWLYKEEWKLIGSNDSYFKCPHCESELKIISDDVSGLAYSPISPSGKKKKAAGKIQNEPYVTVVKIGLSVKTPQNMLWVGEEMPLKQLKEWTETK